ncbi:hypothetical protein Fmac_023762 [Flemingia macrophylla]|uniref:Lumazine-binding domain-containing protein n=1 Tax=Flemingia macrophylla TaxID=520843 RepID=A0ABD1LME6_9FABA
MVVIYDALPAHFSSTFTRCYLLKGCVLMKDTLRKEILLQSGPHYVYHSPLSDSAKFGENEVWKSRTPNPYKRYQFPGRDQTNDKFNVLIDHIWNIPKYTNNNEEFIVKIKKGIICALYNFVSTDNQGVPILTKASPSGKGYTNFVLLSGPHKGVFTNFSDLCMAKEGIQNPRYKGFYTREEADKALELNSIDPEIINNALNPEPEIVIINSGFTKSPKSYKDTIIHLPMDLEFKTFLGIQKFLFKCHQESQKSPAYPRLYIKAHPYFNQRFGCTKSSPMCHPPKTVPTIYVWRALKMIVLARVSRGEIVVVGVPKSVTEKVSSLLATWKAIPNQEIVEPKLMETMHSSHSQATLLPFSETSKPSPLRVFLPLFIGIVEEMDTVKNLGASVNNDFDLKIGASRVLESVHLSNNIVINGMCLTVMEFDLKDSNFTMGLVPKMLREDIVVRWRGR